MSLRPELAEEILAALGDAVVVTDRDGLVTGWHGGAEALFGFRAAEVVGRPVTELFPDASIRSVEEAATLGGADAIDLALRVRTAGGGGILSAVTVRPLTDAGEPAGTVALMKPMAAVESVQELDRRRLNPEWERTLGRLVRDLVEVASANPAAVEETEALAQVLVTQGRRMLPDTEVMMSFVPAERQDSFRIVAGAGDWAPSLVGQQWLRAGTVAGLAMHVRRPIETVRMPERSRLTAQLASGEIQSGRLVPLYTTVPLPDGRDALGVIGFYRPQQRYFTPWERRLIGEFCRLASLMLQGTELRAAMLRSTTRLRATIEAAQRFTRSLSAEDQLRTLVAVAHQAGAERVTVLRVEDDEAHVLESSDPLGPAPVGRRLPAAALRAHDGTPIVLRALERNRMVTARGYHLEGVEAVNPAAFDDLTQAVAMPVAGIGRARVVLLFATRAADGFAGDALDALQTIASIGGVALRNAWLYAEVQEAGRVKSDFLNMAAHELRTPLTVIRGYLSMLEEGSFGAILPAFEGPLRLLQAKTDELGRLVDDLLIAARLDSGRLQVAVAPLDLADAVKHAVERAAPRIRDSSADVRLDVGGRPAIVAADAERLAPALDALLANALVYPGASTPVVRIKVSTETGRAEVRFEDRGRGVPEAERQRIFERFVRVDDSRYPQQPGTGLGLHIARELARRHGGDVVLEWSETDAGSRFLLWLPELEARPDD